MRKTLHKNLGKNIKINKLSITNHILQIQIYNKIKECTFQGEIQSIFKRKQA